MDVAILPGLVLDAIEWACVEIGNQRTKQGNLLSQRHTLSMYMIISLAKIWQKKVSECLYAYMPGGDSGLSRARIRNEPAVLRVLYSKRIWIMNPKTAKRLSAHKQRYLRDSFFAISNPLNISKKRYGAKDPCFSLLEYIF